MKFCENTKCEYNKYEDNKSGLLWFKKKGEDIQIKNHLCNNGLFDALDVRDFKLCDVCVEAIRLVKE